MVGNELLHNDSIRGMVCEACDAGHAEMGILSSETDSQWLCFSLNYLIYDLSECLIIIIIKKKNNQLYQILSWLY